LDDIGKVNVKKDIEGGEMIEEKEERRELIDMMKRMIKMEKERSIKNGEEMNNEFVKLDKMVDYAHCNNVKASVQMMEVCRRNGYKN
jgi:homeodomain interacting protein kinase